MTQCLGTVPVRGLKSLHGRCHERSVVTWTFPGPGASDTLATQTSTLGVIVAPCRKQGLASFVDIGRAALRHRALVLGDEKGILDLVQALVWKRSMLRYVRDQP